MPVAAQPDRADEGVASSDAAPAPVALPTVTPTPAPVVAAAPAPVDDLSPEHAAVLASLKDWGPAPELGNEVWINSAPLRLTDLRGQVVIVEFWTYACINCRNVIPAMREWYAEYHDQGLEIIGVHTPEFSFERELPNVEAAMAELGVTWPVAIDNDKETWRAYANHYWPAMYLVDKAGHVRHLKIGEGQYEHTEQIIQALLAESF